MAKKGEGDPASLAEIKAVAKRAAAVTEYKMFFINAVNLSVAILFPCGLVYFGSVSFGLGGGGIGLRPWVMADIGCVG